MAQFVKAAYASMGTRVCLQSPELGKWVCWGVPAVLVLGRQGRQIPGTCWPAILI